MENLACILTISGVKVPDNIRPFTHCGRVVSAI